jgi:hypothetical protein
MIKDHINLYNPAKTIDQLVRIEEIPIQKR